jgi:iron donor protein CyaY
MSTLSEQEFRVKSDEALEGARQALLPLADEQEFEVEFQNGVLNVLFEEPREAKFVVSPQAPVRQIWISAMSRSFKLAWDQERQCFALNGEPLSGVLRRLCDEFLASES